MAAVDILIEGAAEAWRAAILRDGGLFDFVSVRANGDGAEGEIYLGRVVRVLSGLGGAFVEIGLERPALLEIGKTPPREGDIVMVQLAEPATRRKAARVSRRIALAGRFFVLLPGDDGVTLSKTLAVTPEQRKAINAVTQPPRPGEGLIVRTAAADAPEASLRADLDGLRVRWQAIEGRRAALSNPPARLHHTLPVERLVSELAWFTIGDIVVDSKATAKTLATVAPELADRLTINTERDPLFARHDIADTLADLDSITVALPSGGALTIEPTEALTAIDVDSGTATDAKLRLTTNLEAAREIARQIRLRDLLGVIVVDFIRQDPHVDRDRVLTELRARTKDDRRAVMVLGYTAAGHVELLRTRRGAKEK